ncbi:MAG: sulfatase [Fulvivirga sp.]
MIAKKLIVFLLLMVFKIGSSHAQDRPNILWLTCEDMSPYLRSYGNTLVNTPHLDKLAAEGVRFTMAHSNGAQCSPARSTMISGKYAFSLGTDIHREKRPVPDQFYFPIYLRQEGYYCTNNKKQDYNNLKTPENVWDESSPMATYLNRKDKSKPFFAVFNSGITHMNRVATLTVKGRSPRKVRLDAIDIPHYIPDLPKVRDDIAWHMDAVMLMDQWVGKQLSKLKESGEGENTIIFFFSDHGGTVPRGKGHVYESGTKVPLIAWFPEKWRHLAGMPLPAESDRLVSFIDFAPTIFNMVGIEAPNFMEGKAFFGPGSDKRKNQKKYVITFRANLEHTFTPVRGITDGRYKLIWNYQSAYPNGARQKYQWQMPAHHAWDVANRKNNLNEVQKKFWLPTATFELYDLQMDAQETRNLAFEGNYAKIFATLKNELQNELRKQNDLGFIPREYRQVLQEEGALYEVTQNKNMDIKKYIAAAETASHRDLKNLEILAAYLTDDDPVVQYWGASGICGLAKAGLIQSLPPQAADAMAKAEVIPEVKSMLAEAMIYVGNAKEGLNFLLNKIREDFMPAATAMQNVGNLAKPVVPELNKLLEQEGIGGKFYLRSALINCGALPYSALYTSE